MTAHLLLSMAIGLPALIAFRLAFRWWTRRRERRDLHGVWLVRVLTQCHCCFADGSRVLAQIVCADCSRHACRHHVDPCTYCGRATCMSCCSMWSGVDGVVCRECSARLS